MTAFEATLVSETGIQAVLRDVTSEIAVPVGKYRMHALEVSLKDGHGHWLLRFASMQRRRRMWSKSAKMRPHALIHLAS